MAEGGISQLPIVYILNNSVWGTFNALRLRYRGRRSSSHRIQNCNSLRIKEIHPASAVSGACRCYPEADVNTMPWKGHFSKPDTRKLTMPRAEEGTRASSGFAFAGDVLTGRIGA